MCLAVITKRLTFPQRIMPLLLVAALTTACNGSNTTPNNEPGQPSPGQSANENSNANETLDTDIDDDGIENDLDEDDDNDGIPDASDAFPLDALEAFDFDGDGVGNTADSDDDNDGIEDSADYHPFDASCNTSALNAEPVCPVGAAGRFDLVTANGEGVAYLVNRERTGITRFDMTTEQALVPISTDGFALSGEHIRDMIYLPSHQRVYVSFSNGAIAYVNADNTLEPFYEFTQSVDTLLAAGDELWAQTQSGAVLLENTGDIKITDADRIEKDAVWEDNISSVIYLSEQRLHKTVYDSDLNSYRVAETPEQDFKTSHTSYAPLAISPNGELVVNGGGVIYETDSLSWSNNIDVQSVPVDISWTNDGIVLLGWDNLGELGANGIGTRSVVIERFDNDLELRETQTFVGQSLGLYQSGTDTFVLYKNQDELKANMYFPSDDSDNDGVLNWNDDFPYDPAASIDSDSDKVPETWNQDYTQSDSTSGLTIDQYPDNAACQGMDEHNCDLEKMFANHEAWWTYAVDKNGIAYFLLNATPESVILRYDIDTGNFIGAIGILDNQIKVAPAYGGFTRYSKNQHRIYLSLGGRKIVYLDLNESKPSTKLFTYMHDGSILTAAFGDYVRITSTAPGDLLGGPVRPKEYDRLYTLDSNGLITDKSTAPWEESYQTGPYAWSEQNNRLYYHRKKKLVVEEYSSEGQILNQSVLQEYSSETAGPLLLSPDGTKILALAKYELYDATSGDKLGTLETPDNAQLWTGSWLDNNKVVAISRSSAGNKLYIFDGDLQFLTQETLPDVLPAAFFFENTLIMVSKDSNGLSVEKLVVD